MEVSRLVPARNNRILVFTATFNEAGNIAEWVNRVHEAMPEADILVVDDSSPDGTTRILKELSTRFTKLRVITRIGKLGLASAHLAGMNEFRNGNYDALLTLDADLSHRPEELASLLHELDHVDFVIGTRFGEGKSEYKAWRKFLSIGGNVLARSLIPTGLTEYTTSMRAFRPVAVDAILNQESHDEGYAFFLECIYDLKNASVSMSEVPINFMDRGAGESKIPRGQIFKSMVVLLKLARGKRGE
jgi:dolichol-phosphate mannosyltransferase